MVQRDIALGVGWKSYWAVMRTHLIAFYNSPEVANRAINNETIIKLTLAPRTAKGIPKRQLI